MTIDEQVAVALGWPRDLTLECPEFSTDWSLLPQLLAWLTRENEVGIDAREGHVDAQAYLNTDNSQLRSWVEAKGDTLPLALCRLVLAVRAREEGK